MANLLVNYVNEVFEKTLRGNGKSLEKDERAAALRKMEKIIPEGKGRFTEEDIDEFMRLEKMKDELMNLIMGVAGDKKFLEDLENLDLDDDYPYDEDDDDLW